MTSQQPSIALLTCGGLKRLSTDKTTHHFGHSASSAQSRHSQVSEVDKLRRAVFVSPAHCRIVSEMDVLMNTYGYCGQWFLALHWS